MTEPFASPRDAALALLSRNNPPLSRQGGSFCGQLCVDDTPLSPKQRDWLNKLVLRAGLPPICE